MRRVVALAVVIGFVGGCGGPERVPVYPVSGRVTVNGKPPAGWVAALHLEPAPSGEYPHPLPRAKVEADGRFRFRTYDAGDGAPAGTYRISFIEMGGRARAEDAEDEGDKKINKAGSAKGEKKSRQVYWPNTVEVSPGPNELPLIDIKR